MSHPPPTRQYIGLSDATGSEQDKAPRPPGEVPGRRDAGGRTDVEKAVTVQRRVLLIRALYMAFDCTDGHRLSLPPLET